VGLVLVSIGFYEIGAAYAVMLFDLVGPLGMTTYRNVFGATVLLLVIRPQVRTFTRAAWFWAGGLGLSLAVMNSLFYLALSRIGLGATVTIEALGPLTLSVALARTKRSWLWAELAMAGIVLLERGGFDRMDPVGVALALGAATGWAGYIMCTRRLGQEVKGLGGLAVAMAISALLVAPFGLAATGAQLFSLKAIGLGAIVAVVSSSIPYGMEMVALRTVPPHVFSVLMALAPAAAALSGWALLHQRLAWPQLLGMAAVIVASSGAVLMQKETGKRRL